MSKPIAIQGIRGSFHHEVVQHYFNGSNNVIECMSFDSAVDSLLNGKADDIVMALENSIAGSILPNYALIDKHDLKIVGEYFLDIQHSLMALDGQTINDIKEVHSHPMALLQCKVFLKKHPHIKLVEAKDTADVAKQISEDKIFGIAAIASKNAASIFGLNVLAESIQTIKHNETRFVIVKRESPEANEKMLNKASLKFILDHKRAKCRFVARGHHDPPADTAGLPRPCVQPRQLLAGLSRRPPACGHRRGEQHLRRSAQLSLPQA